MAINLSIIGVVPWREFVPAAAIRAPSFIVSIFMERIYGLAVASVFTLLMLWTAFGSVFALLLGYSRIPFAAARDGYFFARSAGCTRRRAFRTCRCSCSARSRSSAGFFSLGTVIDALIVTRILVQFMGQIVGVDAAAAPRARTCRGRTGCGCIPCPRSWRCSAGSSSSARPALRVILFGLGVLALGVLCFLVWSLQLRQWPFRGAES